MVCSNCSKQVQYSTQMLTESGLTVEEFEGVTFYEGEGCLECNGTGYRGRTAIHELLDLSDRIREMIIERRPTSEIKRVAHEEGMSFLREAALAKVISGLTTLREINKVTFIE
jgi:type IV pilus assembly protein PilB